MANYTKVSIKKSVNIGNMAEFTLKVDDSIISIPIDEKLMQMYKEQFYKKQSTATQKDRFKTLTNLVRAAYLQGVSDGKKP